MSECIEVSLDSVTRVHVSQEPAPASEYFHDFLGMVAPPRAMMLGTAGGVRMSLGILAASKNVHIAIGARTLGLHDLRLAYRCAVAAPSSYWLAAHVSQSLCTSMFTGSSHLASLDVAQS